MKPDEKAFEEHIIGSLVADGGHRAVKLGNASGDFDAQRGLDLVELFAFVEATQASEWERLAKLHGGESLAREGVVDRLAKEIDARGTVDMLRHGVVDRGVRIRFAFFKPAHGLTPELVARYEANRLTVARQLPYEPGANKTLDLTLFVNGVPVATAELKNALTGQGGKARRISTARTGTPRTSPSAAGRSSTSRWTPGQTSSRYLRRIDGTTRLSPAFGESVARSPARLSCLNEHNTASFHSYLATPRPRLGPRRRPLRR